MGSYIVKVLETDFVTHNVKRFVVEKPPGYSFISGQATEVSINNPNWREELRPFTFTSTNNLLVLEFMIKIYTGHNGLTEKLLEVNAGDELIIHDVFGTITYHGPGVFIAAGAGITPFISIFRQLKIEENLTGNTLLFANKASHDIILKDELTALLGAKFHNILEENLEIDKRLIDKKLLENFVAGNVQHYYICGPDKFTQIMVQNLIELGIDEQNIVIEK